MMTHIREPQVARRCLLGALLAGFSLLQGAPSAAMVTNDPFAPLAIYDGDWVVRAAHPWSGAPAGAIDRLSSRCHHFTLYFACEQTVNGKPASLLVYTDEGVVGRLNTRTIAPNGLASGRGELTLDGPHWTYLDKPAQTLKGDWSRVDNHVLDRNHIRFEEFASSDEGETWRMTNSGEETRA